MKDNDALERLLRAAGERPNVPEERLRRARAAAREAWQETVASRTRPASVWTGRSVSLAAAAVVVLALAGWTLRPWIAGQGGGSTIASGTVVVEHVSGAVRATSLADAYDGSTVLAATTLDSPRVVETAADGRVALRLVSGHDVRLDHATRLEWLGATRVRLHAGAIYVDSGAAPGSPGSLVVVTPYGEVAETGTRYEVRLDADAALSVRLREGAVRLTGAPGHGTADLVVDAGRELLVAPDGTTVERSIARVADAWSWAAAAAPPFVLSGTTLADFLDWAEREHGLLFRYAAPDMPSASAAIRLEGGSLEGLGVDEALDVVLASCGWTARPGVEQGVYELGRSPA